MRLAALTALTACRFGFDRLPANDDAVAGDDAVVPEDAMVDALPPTGLFGGVMEVMELNVGDADDGTLTGDQLEVFFCTTRAPNAGGQDIFVATRMNVADFFGDPVSVTSLNTGGDDATPDVSRDGLTMYFVAPGAAGMKDVHRATRGDRTSAWGGKTRIVELSTAADESGPTLTPDGLTLYLSANPSGDDDIYVSTRMSISDAWSIPTIVPGINSTTANDGEPYVNGANTFLLWASNRAGTFDIWMARRDSPADPWGTAMPVAELNSGGAENDPWLSADERTIYFARDDAMFRATR